MGDGFGNDDPESVARYNAAGRWVVGGSDLIKQRPFRVRDFLPLTYKPHIRRKPDDILMRWLVEIPTFTMICYGIRHAQACARSLVTDGLQAQVGPSFDPEIWR